jgi:hypothetical protein
MRCAGPPQGISGGDVALPAKPFIKDQPLDLFL